MFCHVSEPEGVPVSAVCDQQQGVARAAGDQGLRRGVVLIRGHDDEVACTMHSANLTRTSYLVSYLSNQLRHLYRDLDLLPLVFQNKCPETQGKPMSKS